MLRSTWHYVHADDAQWLQELTAPRVHAGLPVAAAAAGRPGDALAAPSRRCSPSQPTGPGRTSPRALAEQGEELTGQQLMLLLAHLEVLGLVCSGVPRDGEHTYALFADRVPAPRRLDRDEALAEIALRYFTSHGPATERDLAYWATLTVTDVRRGIAAAADRLASFEHDGRTFWHAPGDAPASASPAGHLLQVLDEMYRGYQDSRRVLDAEGVVPRGGDRDRDGPRGRAAHRRHAAHGGCEDGDVRDPAASRAESARGRGHSGCRGAIRRVPRARGKVDLDADA